MRVLGGSALIGAVLAAGTPTLPDFALRSSQFALCNGVHAYAEYSESMPPTDDGVPPTDEGASPGLAAKQARAFSEAAQRVAPVVVRIDTIGGAQPVQSAGQDVAAPGFRQADGPTTGVIWSTDGFIVTSTFNFVRDPAIITVVTADGRRFVAQLVARDLLARLALLKIDAEGLPTPEWAPAEEVRIGQWALTAGFGHGSTAPTVTVGVVSALKRMSGRAIQTDAAISPANYGGPLFDVRGRLLGVCVPAAGDNEDQMAGVEWYDAGIGFAIHRTHLAQRVERLRAGQDLKRGLLGVSLDARQRVVGEPLAEDPLPDAGVTVTGVQAGPAQEAGIQVGDVIVAVEGERVNSVLEFRRVMADRAAGDEVELRWIRADEEQTARLRLATAEDFLPPKPATPP